MPRRPEIGNVQLYPDRPLNKADRNGYVLKFYCPIRQTRIRKNCGTRDRREARRILRECQRRLLSGEYTDSGGAITAQHARAKSSPVGTGRRVQSGGRTWDDCYQDYRVFKTKRSKKDSFKHAQSRLGIAERILRNYFEDREASEGLMVREVMTLPMLEYLQERLLDGDECRYDVRSANTVNSMVSSVMAFVRFCAKREWIERVPSVEPLDVDDVMKGRPISGEEFDRMLAATPKVVGVQEAESWQFALRVLWYSGFRIGDLMDFHWNDERHIVPVWSDSPKMCPTINIPSSQKNGKIQQIPMFPELESFLQSVPRQHRVEWIVNPLPIHAPLKRGARRFQPCDRDLVKWANKYSNLSIARACGVTETSIRKWLQRLGFRRRREFKTCTGEIPKRTVDEFEQRAGQKSGITRSRPQRMSTAHVGRIIAKIGKDAGIVVRQADERTCSRIKYASAHDIRRGCAQRLINAGISAESLKVVMRHADFATTEKYYGAMRSAQAAAREVRMKLSTDANFDALVGGLMGGKKKTPQLSDEEHSVLKHLLNRI